MSERDDGHARRDERPPPPAKPGLKLRLEEWLGILDDLELDTYEGHGTDSFINIKGRLIEKKGLSGSAGGGSTWHNILNTFRRLESDEIPGALIRATFRGRTYDLYTDEEGFFQVNLSTEEPLEPGWHEVGLELIDSVKKDAHVQATARSLVPSSDAEFAVVSDLDDTVIQTGATSLLTELKTVLPRDAHSRAPFAGAGELYRALIGGPDDRGVNPIFYVSRSGWNMHDLVMEFLEHHDIPAGPIFLQDLAVREDKSAALGEEHHKLNRIRTLLRDYPRLPFVLVGDSGQQDPETYRRIVHENPDRVRAIYIRDVSEDERDREVEAIANEMRDRGVAMLHGTHTLELAEHAAAHGLISADGLARVRDTDADFRASEHEV